MAEETRAEKETKGNETARDGAGAPAKEAAAAKDEPRRIARAPAFSKLGYLILGAVVLFEAATFILFLDFGGRAKAVEATEESAETGYKRDIEEFLQEPRTVLILGEIEVPILGNQPRAPRGISTTVRVVLSEELMKNLSAKGGHGGGGKDNPKKMVLELNLRSVIGGMLSAEGLRLLEEPARIDFQRKVKERLNSGQLDMDEDSAKVLKVLRGQVYQVIIDIPKPQSY